MNTPVALIPDYVTGTWSIDHVHSDVAFTVRHLGVAKVRGRFDAFEGQIVTAENPLESSVQATIQSSSISTGSGQRDDHIRTADFLDVENHPTLTFVSTGVRSDGEAYLLDGELTIRGITKPVTLNLEINGFGTGFDGKPVVGFSATTEVNRSDFEITAGPAGAIVGEKVKITLEVEANKQD
ncbi:YceI family protein [Microbispora sp. RL4-1S]|uniref:YceI family protein n=1 Tax=Microbispora oryzae TaxID=2806554 RepID=A0A941AIP2_9ACTN|nr:YceI family protein [Microbispora oryzae]MBP2705430.1 YceI family protein [Microbispora oryzae]